MEGTPFSNGNNACFHTAEVGTSAKSNATPVDTPNTTATTGDTTPIPRATTPLAAPPPGDTGLLETPPLGEISPPAISTAPCGINNAHNTPTTTPGANTRHPPPPRDPRPIPPPLQPLQSPRRPRTLQIRTLRTCATGRPITRATSSPANRAPSVPTGRSMVKAFSRLHQQRFQRPRDVFSRCSRTALPSTPRPTLDPRPLFRPPLSPAFDTNLSTEKCLVQEVGLRCGREEAGMPNPSRMLPSATPVDA